MAYDASKEKQEVIALIDKNGKGEYFQVSRIVPAEKNRLESVDIRIMYTTQDGDIKPTSKGVRVNSESIPEVVSAILSSLKPEELAETYQIFKGKEELEEDK